MIFGIGTVVVDEVVELTKFPAADTKIEITRHWKQVGGPVPVALSTAAFYGSKTAFMGRWGNDQAGHFIQSTLHERSIDVSSSHMSDYWTSGFAHVWIDRSTGERTIAFSRGSLQIPVADDVAANVLDNCEILHLDGWASSAAMRAAEIVKMNGGMVVLDAGSVKPGLSDLLPLVDVLIASGLFRRSQFGHEDVEPCELLSLGPADVITTSGAEGASWILADEVLHSPAMKIAAIDTNGAGDIFSGAILHGLANKWDRQVSLNFANAVAGYSCTQHGNYQLPAVISPGGSRLKYSDFR